jgi:hypothetical protein
MRAARRLAMAVSFLTWLFCWSLLRDARAVFNGGALGTIPPWLTGILGLGLILTISTAVTAALRLPVWPWGAVGSAVFVLAGVIGAHLAKLRAAADALANVGGRLVGGANVVSAIRDAFHSGALHVAFFIGAPAVLLVTGIVGWMGGPRTFFLAEEPDGG